MVLASGLLHASWNLVAKRSAKNATVTWLAQFVALAVLAAVTLATGNFAPNRPDAYHFVAWAGVSQTVYFFALTQAYRLGDISVVYPIARGLGVAGACLAGLLMFGEVPSATGLLGIVSVAGGTAAIGFTSLRASRAAWPSVGFALVVAATLVGSSFVDKQGAKAFEPSAYLALVYVVSSIGSAPYFLRTARRQNLVDALRTKKLAIAVIGCGASLSYLVVLFAFRRGPLGYTVAVREFSVVLGALLGMRILRESMTPSKLIGVVAIAIGIALIRIA